ncbi:MAG: RNA polymerase sigma factor [Janthinobacterium lividum]
MRHPEPVPAADADADERAGSADAVVWARLRLSDPNALTEVFDRYARPVYNFAFRRTASWASADDVTQATFVTVWRRAAAQDLPPLEHPTALPWLLGVADRESRGVIRSLGRRRRLQQRLDSVGQTDPFEADHADEVTDRLDDERRMAQVRDAVRVLPDHQRVVVELVVWTGLSLAEAATALGVAEGTVKSRLSRARARLGEQLGPASDLSLEER